MSGTVTDFHALPRRAEEFVDWDWPRLSPYFEELANRAITAAGVAAWLADWTAIADLADELGTRRHVATTRDTTDREAERRYHAYLDEIYPAVRKAEQRLKDKLLASGLSPGGMAIPLRNMRTEAEIFRESNLPLLAREQKLASEYDRIVGAQTVSWDGEERTLAQLAALYHEPDRGLRERAWRAASGRQLADRATVAELWRELLDVRRRIARNADLSDYRAYRWKAALRFDYTPEDCKRFHAAIERAVVPAAARLGERRRRRLGVSSLRPWDLAVDPLGRPPLRPFADASELADRSAEILRRVDPELGGFFDTMHQEGLLDLANRKGKAPGGYCTYFAVARRPFIFMNAVGLHQDVQTLLHEAGHSFHDFEAANLPYAAQREIPMEFAEVASMSMELLAAPYLAREEGGFYDEAEAARARVEHLEQIVRFWPYMAVVDAFQHWVYEHPEDAANPDACDAAWERLAARFLPDVDYTGLAEDRRNGWQRKLHIFHYPFYYVEYGLAQLGAVQVWRRALADPAAAVAAYRRALRLGGTATLPELFAAAGARFSLGEDTLAEAVGLIERTIAELDPE